MTQTNIVDLHAYRAAKTVDTSTSSQDTLRSLQERVSAIEKQVTAGAGSSRLIESDRRDRSFTDERVALDKLYRDFTDGGALAEVVRVREILARCISVLDQALANYHVEIERENHIEVCLGHFSALDYFNRMSVCFKDALTLVQVATAAHRATPYEQPQIVALKQVLNVMRESPNMAESTLAQCITILESHQFDLAGPLAQIDLHELV